MQDQDYRWFLDNYDALYNQYGDSYIAIKNKAVLGTYKTFVDGVEETAKEHERGSFIVQYCNGDETGYTNYITSMNFMD